MCRTQSFNTSLGGGSTAMRQLSCYTLAEGPFPATLGCLLRCMTFNDVSCVAFNVTGRYRQVVAVGGSFEAY